MINGIFNVDYESTKKTGMLVDIPPYIYMG